MVQILGFNSIYVMGGFTSCFGTCCRAIVDQDILDGGNNEGGPFAEVKVNCTLACCQSQALEKRAATSNPPPPPPTARWAPTSIFKGSQVCGGFARLEKLTLQFPPRHMLDMEEKLEETGF